MHKRATRCPEQRLDLRAGADSKCEPPSLLGVCSCPPRKSRLWLEATLSTWGLGISHQGAALGYGEAAYAGRSAGSAALLRPCLPSRKLSKWRLRTYYVPHTFTLSSPGPPSNLGWDQYPPFRWGNCTWVTAEVTGQESAEAGAPPKRWVPSPTSRRLGKHPWTSRPFV